MLSFLKHHPFAVEAFFESSLVLTYAVPKEELQSRIPAYITLDTFNDTWTFIAVAMVSTKALRPKGFPSFLGNDFFLLGYRIFVRYTTSTGKRLRGLYILKSETDKRMMTILGNLFSHYQYSQIDVGYVRKGSRMIVQSRKADIDVEVETDKKDTVLPLHSPFSNWKEARRFAGPLPFTFSHQSDKIIIIEGVREHWIPQPVEVVNAQVGFIKQLDIKNIVLANAFLIQNIPYYWKRGVTNIWKQGSESHLKA